MSSSESRVPLGESRAPPGLIPGQAAVVQAAILLSAAIVVATLYLGRDVLVPIVLGVMLAFVLAPVARALQRVGLPRAAAVPLAVLAAFAGLCGLGYLLGSQAAELAEDGPRLMEALRQKLGALSSLGDVLREADALMRGGVAGTAAAAPAANTPAAQGMVAVLRSVLGPVLGPLATAGLVVIFATLFLLYRDDLRDRLIRLAGARDLHRTMTAMNDAAGRLSRLFLAQVTINIGYGAAIGAVLWVLGVPGPLLWGILAGLMRFVPFIGTPIAILPPLLLALAVAPGFALAGGVLAVFLVGGSLMGQVLEPLLFGKRTGLSPLSVIVSASFWAFLWGPVGLLIATPLTVGLVVIGRHVPRMEFLDVMLGDRAALTPQETFYQRALAGDAPGLVSQAREAMAAPETSLAAYGDSIALRGLVLAQADWSREAIEPEQLEVIEAQLTLLLDDVADGAPDAPPLPGWGVPGAVLCLPGRGQMDAPAARLAALALARQGFGAAAPGAAALETAQLDRLDPGQVRLCCLSVLEDGNSVAGVRTFLRRLARQLPEAKVIVGLWHAEPESEMLAALRQSGPANAIVTTLGEAVALCEAMAEGASGEVLVGNVGFEPTTR